MLCEWDMTDSRLQNVGTRFVVVRKALLYHEDSTPHPRRSHVMMVGNEEASPGQVHSATIMGLACDARDS